MSFTEPTTRRTVRQRAIGRNVEDYTPADMVDRIVATIQRSHGPSGPSPRFTAGLGWYSVAHTICHEIADSSGVPVEDVFAIMAVLSPRCGWADNIAGTRAICHGEEPPRAILPANVDKADRIMRGEPWQTVIGGRKVRSFRSNIADPTRAGAVTVDSHAIVIATGEQDDRVFDAIGRYQMVAAAYRTAARLCALLPHEAQAIAWVQHRWETGADRYDGMSDDEVAAEQISELF